MKYLTRRITYAIIVSIVLSAFWGLVNSSKVLGWDPLYNPAGTCESLASLPYTNVFTATNDEIQTFEQYITMADSGHPNANPNWNYLYGIGSNSMVLLGSDAGQHWLLYEQNTATDQQITFLNDSIQIPEQTYFTPVVIGDGFGQYQEDVWYFTTTPQLFNNGNSLNYTIAANVSCVHKVDNVAYDTNYNGPQFQSYNDEILYNTTCDTFDIPCQINRVFNGIANTFISVGQAIVNGIAALFLPDSATISQYFEDIKQSFNDQIGFLSYPFTFLIDLFNNIDTSDCTPNCDVTFAGTLFGSQVTFDADALETAYPPLWFWLTAFVRASIVVALAIALYKKYMKVVKH